ncbi:hypothetical protein GGS26DRAFT_115623 [Hypomontagnella submonticulosa]|nr:hypothetical protein GGS26DRAFT_115623 [Hypomontagnella submonticulosa]
MDPAKLQALLNGPALAAPPGETYQLDNPPNYRTATTAITTVCLAVATLSVAIRMYTRIRIVHQVNIADYAIVIGWGVFVGFNAMVLLAGVYVPGVHQWNVRLRDLGPYLYYFHLGSIMYGIVIFFIKLSILSQYIQVFMPTKEPRMMYWTTVFFIWANFIFYLVSTCFEIWSCDPIAKAWDPLITEGRCIDTMALNVAASSLNTASDVIILIMPQLIIWRLNISVKNKFGVSVIFLVAIFACACAAVRLYYAVLLQHNDDITYYSWYAGVWTLPEMASGFFVACLPVARKFINVIGQTRLFSGLKSSFGSLASLVKPLSTQNTAGYASEVPKGSNLSQSHSRKPWAKAYGVSGSFSLLDSDSVKGVKVENTFGTSLEEGIPHPNKVHSGHSWELHTLPHKSNSYDS